MLRTHVGYEYCWDARAERFLWVEKLLPGVLSKVSTYTGCFDLVQQLKNSRYNSGKLISHSPLALRSFRVGPCSPPFSSTHPQLHQSTTTDLSQRKNIQCLPTAEEQERQDGTQAMIRTFRILGIDGDLLRHSFSTLRDFLRSLNAPVENCEASLARMIVPPCHSMPVGLSLFSCQWPFCMWLSGSGPRSSGSCWSCRSPGSKLSLFL